MSFDPVSYLLGKQAGGGGGGSLADLDSIAFGNDPTLPSEGKTDPANYEAIADAINTAKARGNAVTLESLSVTQNGTQTAPAGAAWDSVEVSVPNSYSVSELGMVVVQNPLDIDLSSQTSRTINANGTYDTTTNNEVTVDVPQSGGSGYDSHETITGTLTAPFGSLSFGDAADYISSFSEEIGAYPVINYDASAIGAGSGSGALFSIGGMLAAIGANVTSSTSSAFMMVWGANGLVSAYMEQNGTITDISQYASLITTTVNLPTKGGNT